MSRKSRKKVTEAERVQIQREYIAGASISKLCQIHNRSYNVIQRAIVSSSGVDMANEALKKANAPTAQGPLEALVQDFHENLTALGAEISHISIDVATGEVDVTYLTHNKFKL